MALAQAYRFIIYNRDTGVQLDFSGNSANESATVKFQGYSVNTSNGQLSYSSTVTQSASTDLANGSTETLSNNTGNTDIGLSGTFFVETDNASASGNVDLLYEESPDNGTTWPSDASNFDPDTDAQLVATVSLSGAQTVRTNFQIG